MTTRPSTSRGRTVGEVVRGLGALLLIGALLAGLPAALLTLAGAPPLPGTLPGLGDLIDAITRPDDGTLLTAALVWAGWIGWATFAVSLVVEIPAVLRGVTAPRLPALGMQQRLAAGLVAAVATLFTTSASFATPAPAIAHTTEAAAHPAADVAAADAAAETDAGQAIDPETSGTSPPRVHIVAPGDTLWGIAATHLGDPHRYPELFDASKGTIQPDGRRLTDPDQIDIGWHITIPPDHATQGDGRGGNSETGDGPTTDSTGQSDGATGTTPTPTTSPHAAGTSGPTPAPAASPEAASTPGPDTGPGHTPASHPSRSPAAEQEPPPGTTNPPDAHPPLAHPPGPEPTGTPGTPPSHAPSPDDSPAAEPGPADVGPGDTTVAEAPGPADDITTDPDDDEDDSGLCTAGGVGAMLASGLLLYVGAQRARQRRHRPTGHRIALPSGDTVRAEDALRRVHDPLTLDHMNRALRTLAARAAVTGTPLPPLRYARLIGGQLELHLADPADPPAPFRPTANPALWVLDSDGDLLDAAQADDYPVPYPTLVTIGQDPDGGLVLVDLEHTGVFGIDGPDTTTSEVLAAMAAELATSVWSADIHVTVIGTAADLAAQLDHNRISHVDPTSTGIAEALDGLATRVAADRDALAADGAPAVAAARLSGVAEGTWAPEVVLIAVPLDDAQRRRLADLVLTEPRVAAAAVTAHTPALTEWAARLHSDDPEHAVLEPLDLAVTPQRLTAEQHDHMVELLTTGQADPVPAAGPWHVETDPAEPDPGAAAATLDEPTDLAVRADVPLIAVLGQVEVQHVPDLDEPSKRRQLTALAAYLALHPGSPREAIDEAMWPGRQVTLATRNTAMTKLRNWLGTTSDGQDYVLRATGAGYRLHPDITTDWHLFCDLLPNGPALASTGDLRAALSLVRDQPFKGANPRRYLWAERLTHDMIATVADVADELARRALLAGDTRLALATVAAGLAAEPVSEALWRHRLRALHASGDKTALEHAADQLTAVADDTGGELDDDTLDLIHTLLDPPRGFSMFRRSP